MRFTNNEAVDTVIPFGKHKGTELEELPDNYILFLAAKFDSGSTWQRLAVQEKKKRKLSAANVRMPFGKYAETLICDLEDRYLIWCINNLEEDTPVMSIIQDEVDERDLDVCEWDNEDPDMPSDR